MVDRYCTVGWEFDFKLVWKVSIYATWCTRQVSGVQKILICVEHIEKSYKLIFHYFLYENIWMTYIYSTHVSGFRSGYIQVDLYILPKNIKQVFSVFADHDPLLLSTCNLRKFYMGVVLGITMILCILFKSLLLSHSHPISPYRNKYIEISCEGTAALHH